MVASPILYVTTGSDRRTRALRTRDSPRDERLPGVARRSRSLTTWPGDSLVTRDAAAYPLPRVQQVHGRKHGPRGARDNVPAHLALRRGEIREVVDGVRHQHVPGNGR